MREPSGSAQRQGLGAVSRLFVIAMLVMPLTALRIGPAGIGEGVLALAVMLSLHLGLGNWRAAKVAHFWLGFLAICLLSWLVATMVGDPPPAPIDTALLDIAAYGVVAVGCLGLELHVLRRQGRATAMLRALAVGSLLVFGGAAVVSLFTESLGAVPLTRAGRFAPAATNVHHTALAVVALPFVALHVRALAEPQAWNRIGWSAAAIVFAGIAWYTGAAKAVIGLCAGAVAMCWAELYRRVPAVARLCVGLAVCIGSAAVASDGRVGERAWTYFQSLDTNGERQLLYEVGAREFAESPLLGRGPGKHVSLNEMPDDPHMTPLAVALQTGLPGLLWFGLFVWLLVSRAWRVPALLAAVSAVGVYVLGGDVLRRVPTWLLLVLLHAASREARVIPDQVESQGSVM